MLIDTGAGISCCGPSCKFLSNPSDPPAGLTLLGANKSPLPVSKVGRFCLVFGEPEYRMCGTSSISIGYFVPPVAPDLVFTGVYSVSERMPLMPTIDNAKSIHERFGVVDPKVFERLHEVTIGVDKIGKRARDRYMSASFVRAAQQRSRVSSVSNLSHTGNLRPPGCGQASTSRGASIPTSMVTLAPPSSSMRPLNFSGKGL